MEILSFIPLIGMIISFTFAYLLLQQYSKHKGPYRIAWASAMILFGLGFVGEFLGLNFGWSQVSAKIYYFFGAILAVGYLSMGTIYLLKPNVARGVAAVSVSLIFLLWIPIFGIKLFKTDATVIALLIVAVFVLTIVGILAVSASRALLFGLAAVTIMAAVGLIQHNIDIVKLTQTQSWREVMTIPLRSAAFALSSAGTLIILIGGFYSVISPVWRKGLKEELKKSSLAMSPITFLGYALQDNRIVIAVGVFIAALGGTLHGIFAIGKQIGLSLSTTLGIGVMLYGYLRSQKTRVTENQRS